MSNTGINDKELAGAPGAEREAAAEAGQLPEMESFESGLRGKPGSELAGANYGMELLRDVNLEVTVELGRARMSLGDLLEMGQGSVIELDKMAGEPVEIRVNGVLLASGEVIVLDDVFGVRITRINNRLDRMTVFG